MCPTKWDGPRPGYHMDRRKCIHPLGNNLERGVSSTNGVRVRVYSADSHCPIGDWEDSKKLSFTSELNVCPTTLRPEDDGEGCHSLGLGALLEIGPHVLDGIGFNASLHALNGMLYD